MKIAIITDIHHGPASHNKAAAFDALAALEEVVGDARAAGADLLLDLGDRISDRDAETDRDSLAAVASRLAAFGGPRLHLLGNHDVVNLSIADNAEGLGSSMESRVVDCGAFRLLLWQADVTFDERGGFRPVGAALDWLVGALHDDPRPAVIASHVPVSGTTQAGNYYFENRPHLATYPEHRTIRRAVAETGRAALWLSGHVHRNGYWNEHGLVHVQIQSFSERYTTYPATALSHAFLDITGDEARIEIRGGDPLTLAFPFRAAAARGWLAPMPG